MRGHLALILSITLAGFLILPQSSLAQTLTLSPQNAAKGQLKTLKEALGLMEQAERQRSQREALALDVARLESENESLKGRSTIEWLKTIVGVLVGIAGTVSISSGGALAWVFLALALTLFILLSRLDRART